MTATTTSSVYTLPAGALRHVKPAKYSTVEILRYEDGVLISWTEKGGIRGRVRFGARSRAGTLFCLDAENANRLRQWFAKTPLTLVVEDNTLTLPSIGRIEGKPGVSLVPVETGIMQYLSEETFSRIASTAQYAATDDSRPVLTGIKATENECVAADGFRLRLRKVSLPALQGRSILLRANHVKRVAGVLKKDTTLAFFVREKETTFAFYLDGARYSFTDSLVDGYYPEYETIRAKREHTIDVDLAAIRKIVGKAKEDDFAVVFQDNTALVCPRDKWGNPQDPAIASLPVAMSEGAPRLVINAFYLVAVEGDRVTIHYGSPNAATEVDSPDGGYDVIMPMMQNNWR